MSKKNFDLIVFDWDGTLMDSTAAIVKSIQAAARDLELPVPTIQSASYVTFSRRVIRDLCNIRSTVCGTVRSSLGPPCTASHMRMNSRYRSRRQVAHGRCPAAKAVASSRKNSSVYVPGPITSRFRPLNESEQVTQFWCACVFRTCF